MEIEITKELIKAIPLAAFVGSAFTLLGVLYTNSQNRKRMEQQHKFQMEEKRKEMYLQKAEELYDNLELWNSHIFETFHSMIEKSTLDVPKLDVSIENKIKTLSGLYFPKLESDINSTLNLCFSFLSFYELIFNNNVNPAFDEDEIKLLRLKANSISERIHNLKVQLRDEI